MKTFREKKSADRIGRLTLPFLIELLDELAPHALLVPRLKGGGTRARSPQVAKAVRVLVREAVQRGIAVHVVSHETVKKSFRPVSGTVARNWEDVYAAVLNEFAELTVMLPKPRLKIWQPEQYFTPLFNAVAMYLVWQRHLSADEG